jgi:predicted RNase H-like nuclease (RuvC/YqgF family)
LAHELALGEDAQRQRVVVRERVAACTAPIELRIQKREQQVKRLSTKIKALTTRLKTANRSLASLRRSASRIKGEL